MYYPHVKLTRTKCHINHYSTLNFDLLKNHVSSFLSFLEYRYRSLVKHFCVPICIPHNKQAVQILQANHERDMQEILNICICRQILSFYVNSVGTTYLFICKQHNRSFHLVFERAKQFVRNVSAFLLSKGQELGLNSQQTG